MQTDTSNLPCHELFSTAGDSYEKLSTYHQWDLDHMIEAKHFVSLDDLEPIYTGHSIKCARCTWIGFRFSGEEAVELQHPQLSPEGLRIERAKILFKKYTGTEWTPGAYWAKKVL